MKFSWLENLVKEGSVSQADADYIHQDCERLVKVAERVTPEQFKEALKQLLSFGLVTLGYGFASNKFSEIMKNRGNMNAMEETKSFLHNHPDLSGQKELVDARLREIAQNAPSVLADKDLALKLVKRNLTKGFNNTDIESLRKLQLVITSSSGGNMSDVSKSMNSMQEAALKKVGSPQKISMSEVGDMTYDAYVICKTAAPGVGKLFSGRMGELMAIPLGLAGANLLMSTAAGVGNVIRDKMDQRDFAKQLENSFNMAVKESDPERERLQSDPAAARKAFETLVHFAPNVAAQPQAARSFMSRILEYQDQGVQVEDVKNLVEIERNFRSATSKPSPFFSAFSQTGKMLGLDKTVARATETATKPYSDAYQHAVSEELSSQLPTVDPAVVGG